MHIQRGDHWFGIRIANHEPFYPCSADYQQVLLPLTTDHANLQHYQSFLSQAIEMDGRVVADPAEVNAWIMRREREKTDGYLYVDQSEQQWKWSSIAANWESLSSPPILDSAPAFVPRRRVSAWEACRIRNRLNHLAKWTYDILGGGSNES